MLNDYRTSTGPLQISASCRDVLPSTSDPREIDEASGTRNHRCLEASGRSSGHGIEPFVHGNERCRKDFGVDNHELYVRLYAVKRKNKGGISESRKQTIKARASGKRIYHHRKHEAASTRVASFWRFGDAFAVAMVFNRHVQMQQHKIQGPFLNI